MKQIWHGIKTIGGALIEPLEPQWVKLLKQVRKEKYNK